MPRKPPPKSLEEAETAEEKRLAVSYLDAQAYVGEAHYAELEDWLPDDGLFTIQAAEEKNYYLFAVYEQRPTRVGHTRYIGVDKASGEILEIGQAGE